MLNDIKGAIFDMDGTLIDSLMLWDIIWEKLGEKFAGHIGYRPADEVDRAVRTMTIKDAMHHVHKTCNIGKNSDELFFETNEIMKNFYKNQVKLKEGVLEFLEYLYLRGVKMCIASATDIDLVKIALEHCGIGKYFTYILSCAETGKGKDDPDIYRRALDRLGTDVDKTYIFEDALVALRTASGIGIKTIGIYDKHNFGHDEMKRISYEYIGDGESLKKLID